MCNVLIYDIPFGIRVFMHRDGVIREAKYRGMIVKDPGICGRNMYVEYIFWFGSKLGEGKIETSTSIYKTLEDAKREVNPIQHKILDMVIIYQFTPLPTNNHKLYKYYLC